MHVIDFKKLPFQRSVKVALKCLYQALGANTQRAGLHHPYTLYRNSYCYVPDCLVDSWLFNDVVSLYRSTTTLPNGQV